MWLHRLFTEIELQAKWPDGAAGAVVVLQPKPNGAGPEDRRPICLLPMVYRLWVKFWQAQTRRWVDSCGLTNCLGGTPGMSCTAAAWKLKFVVESFVHLGETVAIFGTA